MGKPIDYNVTLYPAEPSSADTVRVLMTRPISSKVITASSLDELLPKVNEYGNAHGFGCQAWVRVANGSRKPRGFDDRVRNLNYNIDNQPVKKTA